ncbi:MAG: anti-sigma factor antagonist [Streptosporangiales bacterium]|nr:anti-sigma factor antagonist [Streptosporangiales bacterium]
MTWWGASDSAALEPEQPRGGSHGRPQTGEGETMNMDAPVSGGNGLPCALATSETLVMPLEFGVQTRDGATPVVSVRGELDLATAERFWKFLYAVIDTHGPDIVVDLSGLAFCDAYGLSAFVRAGNRAEAAGGCLTLVAPRPFFTRVLRLSGLDERFLA